MVSFRFLKMFWLFFPVVGCLAIDPPVYKDTYRAEGFIRLPYAEIVEPFKAYLDTPNFRSRVDYYGGKGNNLFLFKKLL